MIAQFRMSPSSAALGLVGVLDDRSQEEVGGGRVGMPTPVDNSPLSIALPAELSRPHDAPSILSSA